VERGSDMTISFGWLPRRPRNGLKEDGPNVLETLLVDGLSPTRGHGGVRYANLSIPRALSRIIFVLGAMEAGNRETKVALLTTGKSLIEVGLDDERRIGIGKRAC
jgi:hypothetical protein